MAVCGLVGPLLAIPSDRMSSAEAGERTPQAIGRQKKRGHLLGEQVAGGFDRHRWQASGWVGSVTPWPFEAVLGSMRVGGGEPPAPAQDIAADRGNPSESSGETTRFEGDHGVCFRVVRTFLIKQSSCQDRAGKRTVA